MANQVVTIIYGLKDKASAKLKGLNNSLKNTAKSFLGSKLAIGALSVALTGLIVDYAKFETRITDVGNLLGSSRKEIQAMGKDLIALSKTIPTSTQDLAESLFDVVSAGIPAAKSMEFLEVAAKLATAGVTTTKVAVDGLTSVMNAYGLEADKATEISDKFFAAQVKGKTTIEQLSKSIGRVAPIAAATGISIDEMLGSLAALTTQGIKTEEAATGIRATLVSVIKPTEEATKFAAALGIEFNAQALKAKGLQGFLEEVIAATGGETEALAKLFPNVRAINAVLALSANGFKALTEAQKASAEASGETETAFQKQAATISAQFQLMKNNALGFSKTLIEILGPAIVGSIKLVSSFFSIVNKGFKFLQENAQGVALILTNQQKELNDLTVEQEKEKNAKLKEIADKKAAEEDAAKLAEIEKKREQDEAELETEAEKRARLQEITDQANENKLTNEILLEEEIKKLKDKGHDEDIARIADLEVKRQAALEKRKKFESKLETEIQNKKAAVQGFGFKNFKDLLTGQEENVLTSSIKLFSAGKKLAASQAALASFQAIGKAIASAPFPFNIPAITFATAKSAATVSGIAGTSLALAEGGIVRATPGGRQAIIGEGGQDEAVIPLDSRRGRDALGLQGEVQVMILTDDGTELAKAVLQKEADLRRTGELS